MLSANPAGVANAGLLEHRDGLAGLHGEPVHASVDVDRRVGQGREHAGRVGDQRQRHARGSTQGKRQVGLQDQGDARAPDARGEVVRPSVGSWPGRAGWDGRCRPPAPSGPGGTPRSARARWGCRPCRRRCTPEPPCARSCRQTSCRTNRREGAGRFWPATACGRRALSATPDRRRPSFRCSAPRSFRPRGCSATRRAVRRWRCRPATERRRGQENTAASRMLVAQRPKTADLITSLHRQPRNAGQAR